MATSYLNAIRDGYRFGHSHNLLEGNDIYSTKRKEGESILVSMLMQTSSDIGWLAGELSKVAEDFRIRREERKKKK
jgi:hypothetical protein